MIDWHYDYIQISFRFSLHQPTQTAHWTKEGGWGVGGCGGMFARLAEQEKYIKLKVTKLQ